MERLGTFIRATGGTLSSNLTAGGLTENLPEIIALTADVLSNPTYPEDQLALQTERRVTEIQQRRTQPNAIARAALEERVFGAEHPYGRQITEEQVRGIGRADVADYHAARIKGQPFTVFAVGDVTMDDLAQWLADGFADWTVDETENPSAGAAPDAPAPAVAQVPPPEGPRVFLVNMPGSAQSVILAGYPAAPTSVEPDVPDTIASEVLGSGFVSRINLNLREDKGWSYGAGSFLTTDRFQADFHGERAGTGRQDGGGGYRDPARTRGIHRRPARHARRVQPDAGAACALAGRPVRNRPCAAQQPAVQRRDGGVRGTTRYAMPKRWRT